MSYFEIPFWKNEPVVNMSREELFGVMIELLTKLEDDELRDKVVSFCNNYYRR